VGGLSNVRPCPTNAGITDTIHTNELAIIIIDFVTDVAGKEVIVLVICLDKFK